MRIGIFLNKEDRNKCNWFDRKYIEAWKNTRKYILNFRKDTHEFYATSDGITFKIKNRVLKRDQDYLVYELISIITIYFNEDFSQKIHLRAAKLYWDYLLWDQIKACTARCKSTYDYNKKCPLKNNKQISLLDTDIKIPDFANFGEYFDERNNVWKSGKEY